MSDTPDELRERLSPQQYHVTQEGGTDPAFHNEYYDNHDDGRYDCVVCSAELFSSEDKYDSGSGWPSFTAPIDDAVDTRRDTSHGMVREEVVCKRCGAHLGHRFPDGPPDKGGVRYCMNSSAMDFKAATDESSS